MGQKILVPCFDVYNVRPFPEKLLWVPEVFVECSGNFRCWLKADTSSAVGRIHERRSREKNLWHGALLFTVPVDL